MGQVIHVFGASGSGTTTLGKALCDKLGFYHMDTDNYFWLPTDPPYQTRRPIDERLQLMTVDIQNHENVVISGALGKWGDSLKEHFTLVVRLECDTDTRIARLRETRLRYPFMFSGISLSEFFQSVTNTSDATSSTSA